MKKAVIIISIITTVSLAGGFLFFKNRRRKHLVEEVSVEENQQESVKLKKVNQPWGKNAKIMQKWNLLDESGIFLRDFFEKYGYYNIAIYGMGQLGEKLYHQLENTGISVKYVVDRHENEKLKDVLQLKPDDKWEIVDAFVVTTMMKFADLENEITDRVGCPVVSLEEIIFELE